MLIIGAKGFAKEVLEVICQQGNPGGIGFYDDVNTDLPDRLFGQFPIMRTAEEAQRWLLKNPEFVIGVGGPANRRMLLEKFSALGGRPATLVSPFAHVGRFDVHIGEGTCVMTGTVITASVQIGRGCLLNLNTTVGHDCSLGSFCELSPGVHISGNCSIGESCNFGTNATVLPKLRIGHRVTVGAGSVVTKPIDDDLVVVGVPAKPLTR